MNGPWANGDRMAFMRIHWSFPSTYPYTPEIPTFELERNPTVSPIIRRQIIATIQELRGINRQCLVATSGYLLGSHERVGRRLVEEESGSESEKEVMVNVPMLIRTCGATFVPNGRSPVLAELMARSTRVLLPETDGTTEEPSVLPLSLRHARESDPPGQGDICALPPGEPSATCHPHQGERIVIPR